MVGGGGVQRENSGVPFQNIGFPKRYSYITWLFSPPRSESALKSPSSQVGEAPHKKERCALEPGRARGCARYEGVCACVCVSVWRRGECRLRSKTRVADSVFLKTSGAYVAFVVLATCLSSHDPDAEARTSRSWDINSSPCVTKLWQTALLDTQRSHKLCQQHIFLQSKHGYKTGSHHSPPAVCGCSTASVIAAWKCYTRCY